MQRHDKYIDAKSLLAGICLLCGLLNACHKDHRADIMPIEREQVTVTFSAKPPNALSGLKTYTMEEDDENWLEDVSVLVFIADDDDDNNDVFSYRSVGRVISPSIGGGIAQVEVNLWKTDVKTRIVVIANARQQLNDYRLQPGELKGTLKSDLVYEYEGEWKANLTGPPYEFTPIPMWGEYTVADGINEDFKSSGFSVNLLRSLARVDVINTAVTFELREVFVFNSKTSGLIIPSSDNFDGVKVTNVSLPAVLNNNDPILGYEVPPLSNSLLGGIYLFEAEAAEDRSTAPLDEEATALVIGGSYNSGPTTYYRIDFRDASHIDRPTMPLLRNHIYEIRITDVTQDGFSNPQEAFDNMPPVFPTSFGMASDGIRPAQSGQFSNRISNMRPTEIDWKDKGGIGYTVTTINESQ